MTRPVVSVDRISVPPVTSDGKPVGNADGAVWYRIDYPNGEESYMLQLFRKGEHAKTGEAAGLPRNVWGWDGKDFEHPTLSPSYLCTFPYGSYGTIRVHLFLTNGKIHLVSDSNVDAK